MARVWRGNRDENEEEERRWTRRLTHDVLLVVVG